MKEEKAEPKEFFSRIHKIWLDGKNIVLRDLTIDYGQELKNRYGLTLNPMGMIEIPESINPRKIEMFLTGVVEEFGWAASLNEANKIKEHFKDSLLGIY
jgi:hypothetical protein